MSQNSMYRSRYIWYTLLSVNPTICWMIRRLWASLEMSLIMGSLNRFSKFCFWHSTGFLTFSLRKEADLFSYPLMTRSVFLSCVPSWLDPSSSRDLQLPHWPHWHFPSISLSLAIGLELVALQLSCSNESTGEHTCKWFLWLFAMFSIFWEKQMVLACLFSWRGITLNCSLSSRSQQDSNCKNNWTHNSTGVNELNTITVYWSTYR